MAVRCAKIIGQDEKDAKLDANGMYEALAAGNGGSLVCHSTQGACVAKTDKAVGNKREKVAQRGERSRATCKVPTLLEE